MDVTLILILLVFLCLQGGLLWFFLRKREPREEDSKGLSLVLQQINEQSRSLESRLSDMSNTLDVKLGESTRTLRDSLHTQLSESTKIVKDVTEGLTKLDETNRQVISFADQLQNLQDILKNPKQRGILGEYYLETVLKNVLPPGRYQMQYKFNNGEIVDAVVFLDKNKVLPIDSKFSLENYNRLCEAKDPGIRESLEKDFKRDLKNRIDETSKYIRPEENTMDFAFMFIPSEGIYYDLLINQVGVVKTNTRDLIEYAFQQKKVIIVSPTSFLAYLQTVMQGLRSLQIEEQTKEIQKRVGELGRHLGSYNDFMLKLGNAIGLTVNHYNAAHKELGKIDKDVLRITGEGNNIEVATLERPSEN